MPSSLIGRDHPAGVLRAEIAHVLDSHGGLVLVTGEAGIGKTALVTTAAAEAERRGARVLTGSCWEGDGAPGYWPWVQVVRNLARAAGTQEWSAAAAAAGDGLPILLGEPGALAGRPASGDGAAFRRNDAFTSLLVTASRSRPIVVVLDDLHWADPASLRLLDFVVRHAWFEPILVIGVYRDVEIESPDHPLRPLLLPLLARATTVRLTGLEPAGVGALIARATGSEPDAELVAEIHRRTGGNPFFIEQTARLGPQEFGGEAVTAGVRDAVARRLSLLPGPVVDLLSAASVIGHEFDRDLLAAATSTSSTELDARMEPAISTRLVRWIGHGRCAFTHDLVREYLYTALRETTRREWHAAVLRALDTSPTLRAQALAATLAHHARLAGSQLPGSEAIDHLLAAARDASGRLASEEAARHYRSALARTEPDRTLDRATIGLELATALDHAGELTAARDTFTTVIATGRAHDDAELIARAALGLHRLGNPDSDARPEIDLMDEARTRLERSPGSDAALTARVLAAASMARTHKAVEGQIARELSRQAVGLARAQSDDETLGWCLLAHHDAMWEPGTAEARIGLLDELTAVARRAPDRELESLASFLRTVALLEQGHPRSHDEFATFEALTERTRLPRHRFLVLSRRGSLATLTGRFDTARTHIDDAFALGDHVGEVDRHPMWRDQTWALELLRGNAQEAGTIARTSNPGDPFVGFLEAFAATHRGDADVAVRQLTHIETLMQGLPRRFAPMWLVFQAQLAAATKDGQLCDRARAAIAPVVDGWAVFSGAGVIWGPMVHWTALVDAAQQRWDEAVAGFTAAGEAADRLGARPWSVLARAHLAGALFARRAPGDTVSAAVALGGATREATELGMASALDRFAHLAQNLDPPVDSPAAANVFRFDGQVWTLRFAGHTVHMRDAKGLHDLRILLGRPGADVPAPDLLNPNGDPTVARSRRLGADPVLDEQARTAYRGRLRTLDGQIREALDRRDDPRAAALDREREALLDELRRATGLAGRARRLGDDTERARQTVTARIRDTLRRLQRLHPELADHLSSAIWTGANCSYRPTSITIWTL